MNTKEKIDHNYVTAAIIQINKDWQVDALNRKAEDMIGMEAAEIIGRSAKEVFPTGAGT